MSILDLSFPICKKKELNWRSTELLSSSQGKKESKIIESAGDLLSHCWLILESREGKLHAKQLRTNSTRRRIQNGSGSQPAARVGGKLPQVINSLLFSDLVQLGSSLCCWVNKTPCCQVPTWPLIKHLDSSTFPWIWVASKLSYPNPKIQGKNIGLGVRRPEFWPQLAE